MMKDRYTTLLLILFSFSLAAQDSLPSYTKADSLRGSISPERAWWDVQRYDIMIEPDLDKRYTSGYSLITYLVTDQKQPGFLQIDLQPPLKVDRVILDDSKTLKYNHKGNVVLVNIKEQKVGSEHRIQVFFSGKPREAVRPPWDGGWSFDKDDLGRPWMTVTCQGLGASVWYACKDHQSDEPDRGASLTVKVNNDLKAVANGRLIETVAHDNGKTSYKWAVTNPISTYTLIPYIGHYAHFSEKYLGLNGVLDLDYWVMDYNLDTAQKHMPEEVRNTLDAFEYWFGPYPFYQDGFKLVETTHLGMEHQSAVAYGNHYQGGYRGRDLSGTGLGLTFDFIIVHESGHEWFGNNITTNDLADMYVHESFTNYSETLFLDYNYGPEAANDYNYGCRIGIQNDIPIIPQYGVNARGSGDMYPKGANMIHSIRHSLNNDKLFKNILTGLNRTFKNQTVDGTQIQEYISNKAGFDFGSVFDQYLTTVQIPILQLYIDSGDKSQIFYRWSNCVSDFNLPLSLVSQNQSLKIYPTTEWQSTTITAQNQHLFTPWRIEYMYYVGVELLREMN